MNADVMCCFGVILNICAGFKKLCGKCKPITAGSFLSAFLHKSIDTLKNSKNLSPHKMEIDVFEESKNLESHAGNTAKVVARKLANFARLNRFGISA